MKKNNIHSQQDTVQTEHLSRRHFYIIIVLIVMILVALIAHTILRPDRNATLRIIYTSDMQGQITYSDGQYAGYEKVAALSHKLSSEGDHVLLLEGEVGILNDEGEFITGKAADIMTEDNLSRLYRAKLDLVFMEELNRKICICKDVCDDYREIV